jgi:hypothetical protein
MDQDVDKPSLPSLSPYQDRVKQRLAIVTINFGKGIISHRAGRPTNTTYQTRSVSKLASSSRSDVSALGENESRAAGGNPFPVLG